MSALEIRPARRGDADALARLGNAMARLTDTPEVYSRETFERYAFGSSPHFEVLVAETEGEVVGYALFEETFNTDLCEPGMWLHDIMVEEAVRKSGVGEGLMAEVARITLERGRTSLWWGVLSSNAAARRFYARLGARDEGARLLELDGPALKALVVSDGP